MLMTERIITAFLIEQQKQRQQEADALKGKRIPGQPSRKGKKFGMKLHKIKICTWKTEIPHDCFLSQKDLTCLLSMVKTQAFPL
jgi:hypothetical protein